MQNPKINPLNTNAASERQTTVKAQTRQQAAGSRNNAASVQTSVNSAVKTRDFGVAQSPGRLYEGDIIRGEISDLYNNDITITLEDNTILKAKIAGNPALSIGQTAAFRLDAISGGNVLLEALKNSYTETELTLINKALDEANLPATKHNQSAVKALMDNMLPINKESIQHLMQQSYDYKTTDMNTLAIMNRLMMDINSDTVKQFSNYMNGTYKLLGQIKEFSQNIPALLNTLADNGPSETLSVFGEKLLSVALYNNQESVISPDTSLISQLPSEQIQELIDLLSNTPLTEDVLMQLEDGSITVHDALSLIRDSITSGTIKLPEGMPKDALIDKLFLINTTLEQAVDEESVMKQTKNSVKNIPIINSDTGTETTKETVKLDKEQVQIQDKQIDLENGTRENTQQTVGKFNFANKLFQTITETVKDGINNNNNTQTQTQDKQLESENKRQENTQQITGRVNFANKFFQSITETAKNSINNTLNFLQQTANQNDKQEQPQIHTVIDTLSELYSKESKENDYLDSFLTNSEREELLSKFDSMPVSKSFIDKIISGEATAKEVLTVVKNVIPLADQTAVKELFSSNVFENIFKKFLQSSWTISPDELKKDGEISSFYDKMKTQLKQFEGLIQTALSGEDSDNMGRSAHDMESNIEFMKTLNETFSYMQMPLKLQNQDAHADLYVYTQKEKLKKNPNNVHVLLHLTLEHLGDIDIYLDKDKNDINTKFMLSDKPSVDLIKTNTDMLKTALNQQGYSCQVTVSQAETETSTVNEFIDTKINTSATADMKRFSFDIRA